MSFLERLGQRPATPAPADGWAAEDREQATPPNGIAISFPVAFRGYERRAVDEYLEDVSRLIEELESAQTPSAEVKEALDRVGEQTSGILQRARQAEESIVARAQARAEETLRAAHRDARAVREQAEAKVRELDGDTERLWQERQRLLEDVERVFNQLGRVLATASRRFPEGERDEARPGVAEEDVEDQVEPVVPAAVGPPTGNPPSPLGEAHPHGEPPDAADEDEADAGLFGSPPEWEEVPGNRERPIAAYRVERAERPLASPAPPGE
jgi:DivIVA domain-containing protein